MFVRLATVGPVQRISAARLWGGPLLGRGGRRWGHRGGKALYAALRSVMQEDVAQSLADCRYAFTCARAHADPYARGTLGTLAPSRLKIRGDTAPTATTLQMPVQ